jgi:hypothetical protein
MTNRAHLTARYLEAAAAQVPEAQRDTLRRELAERIADTIDARVAGGATPADAEYATLTELGHPARLAADYLDRPLQLIGPRSYLLWRRLIRLVVPIAGVVAALGSAVGAVTEGLRAGAVIGAGVGAGVQVALFAAAGITVVLAVMERKVPAEDLDPSAGWKPEQLPEPQTPSTRKIRNEQIGDVVWLSILGAVVFFGNQFAFVRLDGAQRVRFLDADTFAWLRWALLVLVAAEIVLLLVSLARARWTWWFAGVSAAINLATVALLVPVLSTGRLLDPTALASAGWADGPELTGPGGTLTTLAIVVVVVVCVADAVTGFLRAARQSGRLPR